jgi:hypothetical protein
LIATCSFDHRVQLSACSSAQNLPAAKEVSAPSKSESTASEGAASSASGKQARRAPPPDPIYEKLVQRGKKIDPIEDDLQARKEGIRMLTVEEVKENEEALKAQIATMESTLKQHQDYLALSDAAAATAVAAGTAPGAAVMPPGMREIAVNQIRDQQFSLNELKSGLIDFNHVLRKSKIDAKYDVVSTRIEREG